MGQILARRLAEDGRAVGVDGKSFRRVSKSQFSRSRLDRLLGREPPCLRCQQVAGDQLIASFGVEVGAEQALLRDGLCFCGGQLRFVGGIDGPADFFQAGGEDFGGIVQHGHTTTKSPVPEVGPATRRGRDGCLIGDARRSPHVRYAVFELRIPLRVVEWAIELSECGQS